MASIVSLVCVCFFFGGGVRCRLAAFANEHEMSEREHLVLLNNLIPRADRSRLLRVWRFAGFSLGMVATLLSPRQMYVTTDAVESFVEAHYRYQIGRIRRADHDGEPYDPAAAAELLRMLEYERAKRLGSPGIAFWIFLGGGRWRVLTVFSLVPAP